MSRITFRTPAAVYIPVANTRSYIHIPTYIYFPQYGQCAVILTRFVLRDIFNATTDKLKILFIQKFFFE